MYKTTRFGYDSLHLVADVLGDNHIDEWLKPANLAQRVTMLLRLNATGDVIDAVTAAWHGHDGPVDEWDFDEVTVVEVPAEVYEKVISAA